jgi:DNA-binding transcriptional MocR family regulator
MPSPFKGRWTPVPDDAAFELLSSGRLHAFIVLYAMLAEATAHQCWRTSKSISKLMRATGLSKNTIMKAQKELIAAGYISRVAGTERQKITFEIAPLENFGQKQLPEKKDSKPTGNWEL